MLVCLQLAQRGGTVHSVEVTTCQGNSITTPAGQGLQHAVPEELVSQLLGRSFTDEELNTAIQRMGGQFEGRRPAPSDAPQRTNKMAVASAGTSELLFTMPRWRFDLLHPVDLVEELAIGHGYEDLGEDLPKAPLTAQPERITTCGVVSESPCKASEWCKSNRSRFPTNTTNSPTCVGNQTTK